MSMGVLRNLIQTGLRATDVGSCPSRRTRTEVVIRILEEVLEQSPEIQITLADVASLVCLEKTYCCRLFHSITGRSFRSWIRKIRINKAAALLRTCTDSITEVAHAVGYPDITTFDRNFRKELDLCPTAYRRCCCDDC